MRMALQRPFRHLLIWCLALLLPLQGLSASAGLHCVAMAAAGTPPAAMDHAEHPCHTPVAADTEDAEDDVAAHTTTVAASSDPGDSAANADSTASGHTCSACAACCLAVALPSHSRWAAAEAVAQAPPVLRLPDRATAPSAGLDRPPKTFIA